MKSIMAYPTEELAFVEGTPTRKWEAITQDGVRFRLFAACVTCDPKDIPSLEAMGLVRQQFDIQPNPQVYADDES